MKLMKNALVILAGGKGDRFGGSIPKQFTKIGQLNFIEYILDNIPINTFKIIVISCKKNYIKKYLKKINNYAKKSKVLFSNPGKTRQESSFNALKKLKPLNTKNVLIHDSARPFVSNKLIIKIIKNLKNHHSVVPFVVYNDKKLINNKEIIDKIKNIQTPQGFNFNLIYLAHKKLQHESYSDDSTLMEKIGKKIKYIKGEKTNLKITYPEDINSLNYYKKIIFKHGIGYDIHRFDFNKSNGLKLCGIKIPYFKLIGHSDADVGMHAICDSILGALSLNDIGFYFNNNNPKWKNTNSKIFLTFCKNLLIKHKFFIVNLDINFICEKPNLTKYKLKMKNNISNLLSIPNKNISIKATTNEKIGFIGDNQGIAAESIIQISNEKFY
tara:strand:+ start:6496 stop:7644 length:1149 start_codon:yes stop_codon:yes gene_type:complete